MHVNAKKMAVLGLLLAFAVILNLLAAMIEPSTLFLLAAAAMCTGIAVREYGLRMGFAFLAAGILLALILSPQKLYCLTYGAMSIYIYIRELIWERLAQAENIKHRGIWLWASKYIVFNVMFIPILIFFPKLIYSGDLTLPLYLLAILLGQAALWIYDKAYDYFQNFIWNRLRRYVL